MIQNRYARYLSTTILFFALPSAAQVPTVIYGGKQVVSNEVILRLRSGDSQTLARVAGRIGDAKITPISPSLGLHLLHSKGNNVTALMSVFGPGTDIVYAEPNYLLHGTSTPNDPQYPQLWAMPQIGAPQAWNTTTGSTSALAAVIDTGIDYTHPDLAGNTWSAPAAFSVTIGGQQITCPAGSHGFNAIAMTCDPMDDNSHGSHVSGTIGAVGNNGVGVAGVNWSARIMAVKFLDSSGSGTLSDALNGLEFIMQTKAAFASTTTPANVRVVSASWGGDGFSQSMLDELNKANSNELLFVAAAGNSSSDNDTNPFYPANYSAPNVIAVAATDQSDNLASFSDWGVSSVHLGAPGVSILSTIAGGGYSYFSGTSMATPHVSGAAMLLLSACSVNTAGLKQSLLNNVDAVPGLTGKTITGGRLNVAKAVQSCSGGANFTPIRVNAGGGAYTDTQGNVWSADYGYANSATFSTTNAISGTSDPALYQTERWNPGTLQYGFTVPNGTYAVTLKFAEIYFNNTPGQRVFNIVINGTTVASNFDITAQAGGANIAVDRTYQVNVTSGQVVIQLVPVTQNPEISAIQIVASGAPPIAVAVSPSSVTLGTSGTQQFTATVSNASNQTVTWSISPPLGSITSGGIYQAPPTISSQQMVTVKATSTVDNTTFGTATVTLQPASSGFTPIRVNAGGGAHTDTQGNVWSADYGYVNGSTFSMANLISGTSDPALYQTERWNSGTLQYGFTVPDGTYAVTLKFAEIYFNNTPGQRVFNIVINGTTVASNFDITAQAGGANIAVDRTYTASVTSGQMVIQLVPVIQNPTISAIQIVASGAPPITVAVAPSTVTLGPSGTQQFTATVNNTSNQTVTWSISPQVGSITSGGIYQAPSTISSQQTVTVKATSTVDNTTFGTATVILQPASSGFTPIRVNAGGGAYTDTQGNVWSADYGYANGYTFSTTNAVLGTSDPALYQTERWNSGSLQYGFTVPDGTYAVTLKFAEIYFNNTPGQRVFNIVINGTTVQPNFDITAQAGGAYTAVDRTYTASVTSGQMVIQLVPVIQNPTISAIQIK